MCVEELPDGKIVSMNWTGESLDIFINVLEKYIALLMPHDLPGNDDIREELRKADAYKSHLEQGRLHCQNSFNMTQVIMTASQFGLIVDLLWKELSALNEELRDKRERTSIEGALQGLESRVDSVQGILSLSFIETIPRKKAKVDTLYMRNTPPETIEGRNVYYNQTFFGDVYGAAVNANFGHVFVDLSQESKQAQEILSNLSEAISNMPTEDRQVKRDALSDVTTVQSQLKKKKPSKMIIDGALTSLSMLANSAQIAEYFAAHVYPKLAKLIPLLMLLAQ